MHRILFRLTFGLVLMALPAAPAIAHHLMGGRTPASFGEGILSGLGHPIIGIDHFAAVIAVGCLAAAHRSGVALAIGFVLAMMAGVSLHVHGATVPADELLVAISVVALGALIVTRRTMPANAALGLFAVAGLIHGYALGESIYGAEPTPLFAYLAGLALIQSAVAVAAMTATRLLTQNFTQLARLRLIGAGIVGIGLAVLVQQVIPAA
jgi:urease accessory protein